MMLNLTKKILERKHKVFSISNGTIISFILIISTILMPLSFLPKKAEAQVGIAGYTSGLAVGIAALPQCKDIIDSGVKSLFNGIGSLLSSSGSEDITDALNNSIDEAVNKSGLNQALEDKANSLANDFNSISTHDQTTYEEILRQREKLNKIAESTDSINKNSTCIQSIGRLIIKMLLQKLTVSTVNWINSGFDGSPAFVQDPGKFFNDIAKNEILQFGLEISNPELFPFGKAWMQNTAAAFNNKFQDNAQYSLNKLIQQTNPEFTAETFQQDFSQGGWNAWTAMTQIPANNPLGFKIMADNEIQRRLAGTTQSTAQNVRDALQQANGFLGDQRCTDPAGVTREEDSNALRERGGSDTGPYKYRLCNKWEYVTPGKMISDKATEVLGYQNNAYLNVEDLNDAVAAIADALLGQFTSNIMEKGFANIGDQGANGALVYDASVIDNPYKTQAEKDFVPSQLSSSWLSVNPNFNIRTDLTQALIDEQRTYSDKLALQNKELLSTTDGQPYRMDPATGTSNAYGLIPVIYQLDYCIPGPHPGWEEDSRRTLAAATDTVLPQTQQSLESKNLENIIQMAKSIIPLAGAAAGMAIIGTGASAALFGVALGSAAGPVGALIGLAIGAGVNLIIDWLKGSDEGAKVRAYYAYVIAGFTGYLPDNANKNDDRALNLESKEGAVAVLNTMLDRYAQIINKIYYTNPEILPSVSKEAASSYYQLNGYAQMMKNNDDKIASLKSTVNILGDIKNAVNILNDNLAKSQKTSDDYATYENDLKTQINAFGRLSSTMVNGDDIAGADSLLKQIIDKKNYLYSNPLKGTYGCEAFLQNKSNIKKFPSPDAGFWGKIPNVFQDVYDQNWNWNNFDVNSEKRMTYPFPILYDYNKFTKGVTIPDPWGKGSPYCALNPTNSSCLNKFDNIVPNADDNFKNITDAGRHLTPEHLSSFYDNGNLWLGPGFLSFVFFSSENNVVNDRRGSERLPIHDILPTTNPDQSSMNKNLGIRQDNSNSSGVFETLIGVY